jgi:adenylate cyclase class 2
MGHLNVEIKARCENQNSIREILRAQSAKFEGIDHQIDIYFNTTLGRLKLRKGNIENFLVQYDRENISGPKQSKVTLYKNEQNSTLEEALTKSLGILVTVDKQREIYWIENVKFHLDKVQDLGTFVEIEAIDFSGNIGREKLTLQCQSYLDLFQMPKDNLISVSYSDLLLTQTAQFKN